MNEKFTQTVTFKGIEFLTPAYKSKIYAATKIYSWLEDITEAWKYSSFPLDIPLYKFSYQHIENAAMMARDVLGVKSSILFDLPTLLETAGLRMVVLSLPKEITSFSFFEQNFKSIFFFINKNNSFERNCFTLAHELAHIIFHQGGMKYNLYRPGLSEEQREKAASYFASCFLMPENMIKNILGQLGIKSDNLTYELLLRLKTRFGVSAETFIYRLSELKLIRNKRQEEFLKEVRKFYKKTNFKEPPPSRIGNYSNDRIWDLVLVAEQNKKFAKEVAKVKKELIALGIKS